MADGSHEKGLRLIIDGSMARGGGGFTYLVNVIPELLALAPEHRFQLLIDNERLERALPASPNLEVVRVSTAGVARRIRSILFDGSRRAASWKADLYFSVAEYAPLRAPCPVIAAFRNPAAVIPVEGGWPLNQRVRLAIIRRLAALTAKACTRVIFVSRESSDFIGESAGVPEVKREVIHHGINPAAWSRPVEKPTQIDSYILSVSSVYRYKNYVRLIEGWAELCARRPETPDLVIIGDNQDPPYLEKMFEAKAACGALASRVHLIGEVAYEAVVGWYRFASLFVFPSYLETFGHPLLEAMASNVPIVAADIPVSREVAGDAALYAAPKSPSAFADRMEEVLSREDVRQGLVAAGRRRIDEFTWTRTAESLLDLFVRTVRGACA